MPKGYPSEETVARVREMYPCGCRVELVSMNDSYNAKLLPGDQGTVDFVDDTATVFVSWDSGSRLGAAWGEDSIKRIFGGADMNKRQVIYDELSTVLTNYEGNGADEGASADDLYNMLVKIQNCWESIITADDPADRPVADSEKSGDCHSCLEEGKRI